jgi:hypothetical protein
VGQHTSCTPFVWRAALPSGPGAHAAGAASELQLQCYATGDPAAELHVSCCCCCLCCRRSTAWSCTRPTLRAPWGEGGQAWAVFRTGGSSRSAGVLAGTQVRVGVFTCSTVDTCAVHMRVAAAVRKPALKHVARLARMLHHCLLTGSGCTACVLLLAPGWRASHWCPSWWARSTQQGG